MRRLWYSLRVRKSLLGHYPQETVRDQIWTFYQALKAYKLNPNESDKLRLGQRFDEIFTQKTAYHSLNQALGRLYDNKAQLLLVLERPDIPLHNNLSEVRFVGLKPKLRWLWGIGPKLNRGNNLWFENLIPV